MASKREYASLYIDEFVSSLGDHEIPNGFEIKLPNAYDALNMSITDASICYNSESKRWVLNGKSESGSPILSEDLSTVLFTPEKDASTLAQSIITSNKSTSSSNTQATNNVSNYYDINTGKVFYDGVSYYTDQVISDIANYEIITKDEYGIANDGTIVKILGRDKNGNILATFVSDRGESNDKLYIRKYNSGDFKEGKTNLNREEALKVTGFHSDLVDEIDKKLGIDVSDREKGYIYAGQKEATENGEKTDTIQNEVLTGDFAKQLDECLGNEGEKATAVMEEYNSYKSSFDILSTTMNSLKQSGKWKDTGDIVVKDLQKRYDTLKSNLEILDTVAKAKDELNKIRESMKSEEQKLATAKKKKAALEAERRDDLSNHVYDVYGNLEGGCNEKCTGNVALIAAEEKNIETARGNLSDLKTRADELLTKIQTESEKVKDYKYKDEIAYLEEKFKVLDGNKAKKTTPTSPGGGNNNNGGGGDATNEASAPVEAQKPIELPDMTADQIKIYEEMTIDQLNVLTDLLESYAKYKGLTLTELLKDVKYQDEVIEYLTVNNSIPASLKETLTKGDRAKSYALLNSLYSGGQPNVVGITENTKKTLATYLSDVAENNNMTFKDLMGNSGTSVLKTALSKFEGVKNNIASARDYKTNFIDIYDGNNISTLSEDTVKIERMYGDVVSNSQNKDIEKYFESNTLNEDFETLGKFSTFSKTVSNYDDTSIRNVVYGMLT